MLREINLKKIRQRTHHSIFEDGLVEIMLGIGILLGMLYVIDSRLVFFVLWIPVTSWLFNILRKRFTYPRTGYVKVKASQVLRVVAICVVGFALSMVVAILVWAMRGLPFQGRWPNVITLATVLLSIGFPCVPAYLGGIRRWYAYSVLSALTFAAIRLLDAPLLPVGLGIVFFVTGLVVFVRFVHSNPVLADTGLDEEASDGGS